MSNQYYDAEIKGITT